MIWMLIYVSAKGHLCTTQRRRWWWGKSLVASYEPINSANTTSDACIISVICFSLSSLFSLRVSLSLLSFSLAAICLFAGLCTCVCCDSRMYISSTLAWHCPVVWSPPLHLRLCNFVCSPYLRMILTIRIRRDGKLEAKSTVCPVYRYVPGMFIYHVHAYSGLHQRQSAQSTAMHIRCACL